MKIARWIFILVVITSACVPQQSLPSPTTPANIPPTATQTLTPAPTTTLTPEPTFTATPEIIYQPAFGIDYANPEQYLSPGEQTKISNPEILDPLRSGEKGIPQLQLIYRWLKKEFEAYSAGGKTIGVVTTDQLLEERRLGGCNDHGLVFVAVARELGYPAVLVVTNSIAWMELYQAGQAEQHVGHVFVEVFVDGRWVLVDSTNGWYVEEGYDPTNPVIPLQGAIAGLSEEVYGFYVTHKGIDQWDIGIHSQDDRYVMMEAVADQISIEAIVYPEYNFKSFKRN